MTVILPSVSQRDRRMKTCPSCHQNYDDDTMRFCLKDGSPLQSSSASDPQATLQMFPNTAAGDISAETRWPAAEPTQAAAQIQHPSGFSRPVPPEPSSRSLLPWVAVGVVLIGVVGILSAYLILRSLQPENREPAQASSSVSPSPSRAETAPASDSSNTASTGSAETPGKTVTSSQVGVAANPSTEQVKPEPKSTAKPTPASESGTPKDAPPPVPTPPKTSGPISGGVLNARAISLPKPQYPAIAKQARASGTVVVQVTIDENGNVISARAVSGHPLLHSSSVAAARQAKFRPTKLAGQPVKVTGVINYNYVMQ